MKKTFNYLVLVLFLVYILVFGVVIIYLEIVVGKLQNDVRELETTIEELYEELEEFAEDVGYRFDSLENQNQNQNQNQTTDNPELIVYEVIAKALRVVDDREKIVIVQTKDNKLVALEYYDEEIKVGDTLYILWEAGEDDYLIIIGERNE